MKRQGGRSQLHNHNGDILEMENVSSMFMYVVCVCVWLWMTLLEAPSPLPGKPGEALMWQRQSLWSAGLTLWCCGQDAEPVSTNPISITLAASYLWLRWPSALPPPHKSSLFSCSFILSLYHPFLYCTLHFSLFLPPPNRNPMAIILMQYRINPRKRRCQKWNRL